MHYLVTPLIAVPFSNNKLGVCCAPQNVVFLAPLFETPASSQLEWSQILV